MSREGLEPASAVARRLFGAIAAGRWSEAAACIDPADVQRHYDAALAVKSERGNPALSADREAVAQARTTETSTMSRAVRQALLPRARLPFPFSVLGAITPDELRSLSGLELMARVIEAREAAILDQQPGRPPAFEWEDEPAQAERSAKLLRVVLGEAQESDAIAHVVFRRVLQELEGAYLLEPIGCVTFCKLPAGWRVALSPLRGTKPRLDAGPWRVLVELKPAWL